MDRLSAARPASYQIRNMAEHRVRRVSSDFICVQPLNQHLMESRGTMLSSTVRSGGGGGGGGTPPSAIIFYLLRQSASAHFVIRAGRMPIETLGNVNSPPPQFSTLRSV